MGQMILSWAADVIGEAEDKKYADFEEKFKARKTTDDCYTPERVYDAVLGWAAREYGVDPERVLRPFYPGRNYREDEYPDGWTVVDNPPFSILGQIIRFYCGRKIPFLLFAPSLTCLTFARSRELMEKCTAIITDSDIIYANGAAVKTAFITNLEPGIVLRTAPELREAIRQAVADGKPDNRKPVYVYPECVTSAALFQKYAAAECRIRAADCVYVSRLDSQKESGKSIFGGGLLLNARAAGAKARAEQEAAELAARKMATEWPVSPAERAKIPGGGVSLLWYGPSATGNAA